MRRFLTSLFQKIFDDLHLRRANSNPFQLDEDLLLSLQEIAEREQRSQDEIARELIARSIQQRKKDEIHLALWKGLYHREQQVVALCCLGYENRQIAERLSISLNTVKSHVRSAAQKLGVQTAELMELLAP